MHDEKLPLSMSEEEFADDMTDFDLLEAYLDDELSEVEKRRFERRLTTSPELASELELATAIRGGLRAMGQTCPAPVLERVHAATGGEQQQSWWFRLLQALSPPDAWQPTMAAVAMAAIAAVALWHLPISGFNSPDTFESPGTLAEIPRPHDGSAPDVSTPESPFDAVTSTSQGPSPVEVEQARREIELAFAYLGKLGRTAETSVRQLAVEKIAPGKLTSENIGGGNAS